MKFLYKIHSGYDGFTPRRIPARMTDGNYLRLGWQRYLDAVSPGDECWIYFHGPHAFVPGAYVNGYIAAIDREVGWVSLRVREYRTDKPLTDVETSRRIAEAVSVRYRQVFLWPEDWKVVPECNLASCARRLCDDCPTWTTFGLIDPSHLFPPERAPEQTVVSAYWIIPNRCYIYVDGNRPALSTARISHLFGEFKLGEARYSYPLARGIWEALRRSRQVEFDAVVPVPLSPDKVAAGELHRTLELARELGRLLGAPVRELLTLAAPISKRRMLSAGLGLREFERQYSRLLAVGRNAGPQRVLLVDDVITRGSTIQCCIRKLREAQPDMAIVAASAGQMIVKSAVANEAGFLVEA